MVSLRSGTAFLLYSVQSTPLGSRPPPAVSREWGSHPQSIESREAESDAIVESRVIEIKLE
jgi:hypothetical protein